MNHRDLEKLDTRIQSAFALVSSRLWRRRVTVRTGEKLGTQGVIQSVSLGPKGEVVAAVRVDKKFPNRLRLPLTDLTVGDVDSSAAGTPRQRGWPRGKMRRDG